MFKVLAATSDYELALIVKIGPKEEYFFYDNGARGVLDGVSTFKALTKVEAANIFCSLDDNPIALKDLLAEQEEGFSSCVDVHGWLLGKQLFYLTQQEYTDVPDDENQARLRPIASYGLPTEEEV